MSQISATNIYRDGFRTFLKIGFFTIGGGYAMIPLFHEEIVVKHKWLSDEDFLDVMSMAQSLPGVFAINFSIYTGHRLKGLRGSLTFALGTAIPSFLIILAIAMCFQNYSQYPSIEAIMKGIRPSVVALIAVPCLKLWKNAHMNKAMTCIPIIGALLIWLLNLSPVIIILLVAIGSFIYSKMFSDYQLENNNTNSKDKNV